MSSEGYGQAKNRLNMHWMIVIAMLLTVVVYVFACHYYGQQMQIGVEESQRVLIRTILYVIAIVTFPFATLLRHILLRLNQTMPGDTPAGKRYLVTVVITQAMMETVAIFGLVMFMLGDDYNTLYIFSTMAVLGVFLHRPKMEEYRGIVRALSGKELPDYP
ncbi:hypothetical protein Q9L42_002680 [Methylomarinum sp. Ch1-1]|uniref:Uncharacterized protein n=1 Tax=Methylomarinum roseum TaxID=3067653 RepID=A0AAU7NVL8_9GAMM